MQMVSPRTEHTPVCLFADSLARICTVDLSIRIVNTAQPMASAFAGEAPQTKV
jgi:hypothetical protein